MITTPIDQLVDVEILNEELNDYEPIGHGNSDGHVLRMLKRWIVFNGVVINWIPGDSEKVDTQDREGYWCINRIAEGIDEGVHVLERSEAYQVAIEAIKNNAMNGGAK